MFKISGVATVIRLVCVCFGVLVFATLAPSGPVKCLKLNLSKQMNSDELSCSSNMLIVREQCGRFVNSYVRAITS